VKYETQFLKVGESDVPGPEVDWMRQWNTWETLYFYVVVIRGGGKLIVINSGPPTDLARLNDVWVSGYGDSRSALRRTSDELTANALRVAGVDAASVDYLLLTPLQAYTTGNVPPFSKASTCISMRGWIEDFHAPRWPMQMPRDLYIPDDVLVYLETRARPRIRLIEGDEEIVAGIRARWVRTHHRSSMAFLADTAVGTVAVSDCFFKYPNFEQNIPLGVQESMEECMRSYALMRRSANPDRATLRPRTAPQASRGQNSITLKQVA
jgi:glyoxylase-like metal-dependent hydrolase (beta-lactamase superfamily II)